MDGQDLPDKKWKRGAKRKRPQIMRITQIRKEEEKRNREWTRMNANKNEEK